MTTTISATELKNRISEVLDSAYFKRNITVIERYGKPIAEIRPAKSKTITKEEIKKVLDETFGSIPDFPDVTKFRNFRRRSIK